MKISGERTKVTFLQNVQLVQFWIPSLTCTMTWDSHFSFLNLSFVVYKIKAIIPTHLIYQEGQMSCCTWTSPRRVKLASIKGLGRKTGLLHFWEMGKDEVLVRFSSCRIPQYRNWAPKMRPQNSISRLCPCEVQGIQEVQWRGLLC